MSHFVVLLGDGRTVGFFPDKGTADGVASVVGGLVDECDGPMPSNDELAGWDRDDTCVILRHPRSHSGFSKAIG